MDSRNNSKRANGVAGRDGGQVDPSGRGALARASRPSNPDKLRILWYSNAPWTTTGYGQQTAQVIQRLAKEENEVAVHAMYGLAGSASMWNGFKIYPQGVETYSNDVIAAHLADWSNGSKLPPLLMTLFDTWVLKSPSLLQVKNIASWVPIDHQPAPPEVAAWCDRPNVYPIAMSKFGSKMLDIFNIKNIYVPHAIEPIFKPTYSIKTADGGSMTGRQYMGFEDDHFVVSICNFNKGVSPSRKAFAENLLAFGLFAADHPDARLYLYTEPDGAMGGVNLRELCISCGIGEDKYKFVDQYSYRHGIQQGVMAAMYTASDVLLSATMGEGFGIPVIEAQACGTRVIVSNFSAQPELVGDGWIVDGQPWWDQAQNSWFFTPRVTGILDALKQAYDAPRSRSDKAIAHARGYGADVVFEQYWKPAMKELSAWCRS